MGAPGFAWLKEKLRQTDEISGGYPGHMGHPVAGGAGFAMSAVYVLAWLLALIPLCLWRLGRWASRRTSRGGDPA